MRSCYDTPDPFVLRQLCRHQVCISARFSRIFQRYKAIVRISTELVVNHTLKMSKSGIMDVV